MALVSFPPSPNVIAVEGVMVGVGGPSIHKEDVSKRRQIHIDMFYINIFFPNA